MQLWLGSCSPNISISPYVVEQGGMLDTVLEHVVTVTMDEEGEEMEQREVERWECPIPQMCSGCGLQLVLHNTAARSYLHAEDRSREFLNFYNNVVESVNQK